MQGLERGWEADCSMGALGCMSLTCFEEVHPRGPYRRQPLCLLHATHLTPAPRGDTGVRVPVSGQPGVARAHCPATGAAGETLVMG
jgi:hypothetical protein